MLDQVLQQVLLVLEGACGMIRKKNTFVALTYSNRVSIKKSPLGLLECNWNTGGPG